MECKIFSVWCGVDSAGPGQEGLMFKCLLHSLSVWVYLSHVSVSLSLSLSFSVSNLPYIAVKKAEYPLAPQFLGGKVEYNNK